MVDVPAPPIATTILQHKTAVSVAATDWTVNAGDRFEGYASGAAQTESPRMNQTMKTRATKGPEQTGRRMDLLHRQAAPKGFCTLVPLVWRRHRMTASWERGRPAPTKPGAASALSPTCFHRERRHGSPSAWPMRFPPAGWLARISHQGACQWRRNFPLSACSRAKGVAGTPFERACAR